MGALAKVVDMQGKRFVPEDLKVIPGGAKLTKDGKVKQTPNNGSGEHFVYPIKDSDKIEQIKNYLWSKITNPNTRKRDLKGYGRDYLMFCIGINVGLRYSDLVNLTWDKIFRADMKTFRTDDERNKKEQKTGKQKVIYINDGIKDAVQKYIDRFDPELGNNVSVFDTSYREIETYTSINGRMSYRYKYLGGKVEEYEPFEEMKEEIDKNGKKKVKRVVRWTETVYKDGVVVSKRERRDCKYPVSDTTVGNFIKEACQHVGIEYPVCTHTLRKTYVYHLYMKNQDNPFILSYIQHMMGHTNQAVTLRYLGLEREVEREMSMDLNL